MADLSITPANVVAAAGVVTRQGVAGATITAGQVVYLDPADDRYKLADSDAVPSAGFNRLFLALNGAANGQPLNVLRSGLVALGAVMTAGTSYYLSDEPGGIAPRADLATGDDVILLGVAASTSVLIFAPIITDVTL
jgi:hypothetical protein